MASAFDAIETVRRVAGLLHLSPHVEPQKTYQFEVNIYGQESNPDLMFFAKSVEIPTDSREPINVPYLDTNMVWPGRNSSAHTFTVTFWDDQNLTLLQYMQKWIDLTGNWTTMESVTKTNPIAQYARTIHIDFKDNTDLVRTGRFEFETAFPIEIGTINASYEDTQAIEVQVSFAYDERTFSADSGLQFNYGELF